VIIIIKLTGLNHKEFVLNADHIERVEQVPETMITLVNGKKYMVLDKIDDVIEKVVNYKNKIFRLDFNKENNR
jgi:flagellar protein FlbD